MGNVLKAHFEELVLAIAQNLTEFLIALEPAAIEIDSGNANAGRTEDLLIAISLSFECGVFRHVYKCGQSAGFAVQG